MSVRQRMIYRAYIQRNGASANTYGHASPGSWSALSTTACFFYIRRGDAQHEVEHSVAENRVRIQVPLGTDVTEDDRVQKVTDRQGVQVIGLHYIDVVLRRKGHIELRLRRHE